MTPRLHITDDPDSAIGDADESVVCGLPAWTYTSRGFFDLELERVFKPSWQVVCHQTDVPNPGDYFLFEFLGRPIVVMRGEAGAINAFYNVCRHRAARLLDGSEDRPTGHCTKTVRCPYHAWTYDLEGRLKGVPHEAAYKGLDKSRLGLHPVTCEVWQGFVFINLDRSPTLSVADMMAPYSKELDVYRLPEMEALGRITLRPRNVNWKTVTDNYVDGLHINVAHTGLKDIAGRGYSLEVSEHVSKMSAPLESGGGWSPRLYLEFLPHAEHLPAERQKLWSYYMLWPNTAFDVYPDQLDFMQMLPVSPGRTLIREIAYALPDDRREMRAARYLNWRVNRVVNAEDRVLLERVQAGMESGSFDRGPLSDDEICLRHFADRIRAVLPEARRSTEHVGDKD